MNFETEQKYYKKTQEIRNNLFLPLLKIFSWLNLSPNHLSFLGVFSMIIFLVFGDTNIKLGIFFVCLSILFDWMDGPLARFKKIDSDKGKFIDMACDNLSFTIFVISILKFGIISGPIASLLVYFMLTSKILRAIFRAPIIKSDWLFVASSGFYSSVAVFCAYFLFIISNFIYIANLNLIYLLISFWLIFDSVKYFKKILKIEK